MMRNIGLQIRLTLAISLIALFLGTIGYAWISNNEQGFINRAEQLRSLQTAHAMTDSLKAIMIAGHGDIAHDWLRRVRHSPGVLDARVYRRNGTEAFCDAETVKKVNRFLGESRFSISTVVGKKKPMPAWLARGNFRRATSGEMAYGRPDERETAILMPIRTEPKCLRCHGYDPDPVRGVLLLRLPSEANAVGMAAFFSHQRIMIAALALIFVAGVYLWAYRLVARPVVSIARAADRITDGGSDERMPDCRTDELGVLSRSINTLLDKLDRRRHHERTIILLMLGHHKDIKTLMHAIGKAARRLTGARYAMVSYKEDGAPVFRPLGMDIEEMQQHGLPPPRGLGLLGQLWDTGELLRLDDIAAHPSAAGFPKGHPPMTSFLGIGIKADGEVNSVLYLTREEGVFTAADEEIVRVLGSAAALAVERLRHIKALKSLNKELESHVQERTRELAEANRRLISREMDLEAINHKLLEAGRAKDEFIANASHELRTPLNAIIGFTELMRHPRYGSLGGKQQSFLEKIANSSKRLVNIINDMLDIARIESGRMEIHEEICHLGKIATQLEGELASLAVEKDVQFHVRAKQDAEINADAERIRQIMINLLGNALKFTPAGGTVEGVLSISGDDFFQGVVNDTGIGIEDDDIERIFRPFEQVETGETRTYKGTGLGLALSRQMASLLGGSLTAASTSGKGSCFTLRIPVHRLKMHEAAGPELEPVMPVPDAAPAVLVIDSDAQRRCAVMHAVEADGYGVYAAAMKEAGAMARGIAPFVVLYGEPGDPKQMMQELAALKRDDGVKDLPVVLISGDAETPRFSWGAVEFSGQDMNADRLLDCISRYGRLLPLVRKTVSVLVIDDDPDVHHFLRELLAAHGYRMFSARTGEAGLRMARDQQPNVIILDLMLPMTSGFGVMEALARDPNTTDIPVMIYSGRNLSAMDMKRLGTSPELVVAKGEKNGLEIVTQLRRMELLYPVQARLVDPMLGMKNARYLRLRLIQEERQSRRHRCPFSVIGWNMDGFADYEAAHSVRWATVALCEMSKLVRTSLRLSDEAIRVGKNRFVLMLPGLDQESAYRVAEKLRIKISHARWTLPNGEWGEMTASFAALGVMERETWRSKTLLDILWRTLNQAMTKRNCTLVAEEGVDESADRG